MIDYKKFQFATAPLTGCRWFTMAAQLVSLGFAPKENAYHYFSEDACGVLRVSLVRHPCHWLADLYQYLSNVHGSTLRNVHLGPFIRLDSLADFSEFVAHYLENLPGQIGGLMFAYQADSFLRAEDFPQNFVELSKSIDVDATFLRNIFFQQRPTSYNYRDWFVGNEWRAVCQAERKLCEFGDYY